MMSQNRILPARELVKNLLTGFIVVSASAVVAEESWVAPAPMGPYGGHFDFGVPVIENSGQLAATPLQPEYAMYRNRGELPVVNASYATLPEMKSQNVIYQQDELTQIDPAWSLDEQAEVVAPLGGTGMEHESDDVWALGEIRADHLPQLLSSEEQVANLQQQATKRLDMTPCTTAPVEGEAATTAHSPYQEALLDEFESAELDMDVVARDADQLSRTEERNSRQWSRMAPTFYPTFMPDYALGVRRADAMDPLALIPQMRNPVQYFGFQQQ